MLRNLGELPKVHRWEETSRGHHLWRLPLAKVEFRLVLQIAGDETCGKSIPAAHCSPLSPNLVSNQLGATMTEAELIQEFQRNRLHIILAQLAPTGLLAFAALATPAIAESNQFVVHAFALILLASGILGALAEYSAAAQAQAVIDDLKQLPGASALVIG